MHVLIENQFVNVLQKTIVLSTLPKMENAQIVKNCFLNVPQIVSLYIIN